MAELARNLEWMAWTRPTAIFFLFIFTMLAVMTVYGVRRPAVDHKGFLPIRTTRGDRLYIGLLVTAFINLAWLGFTDLSQLWAVGLSIIWMTVVLRWG